MILNLKTRIYRGKWVDVKGYEGLYQVSNLGQARTLNFRDTGRTKLLKLTKEKKGYYRVSLIKDHKTKFYKIYRLVAEHFIPNPEDKPQIDHIDTKPSNNRVWNLRWVFPKENSNNPLTKKHHSDKIKECWKDEEYKNNRLSQLSELNKKQWQDEDFINQHSERMSKCWQDEDYRRNQIEKRSSFNNYGARAVYCVELDRVWLCTRDCGNELNICEQCIRDCCKGRSKSAGGYHFRFATEEETKLEKAKLGI